jgi:uncharacterized membrane protein
MTIEDISKAIPIIVNWVAIVIFLVGFAKATFGWLQSELRPGLNHLERHCHLRQIRLSLGSHILLGLEIMIISDVVSSCIHPDLMSMAELGALVVVRTAISFFLGRELEQLERQEKQDEQA